MSPGGRQQSQDGGLSGEEGGPDFPPPLLYSIPFPLPPGLDPCRGGAPPLPDPQPIRQSSEQPPGVELKMLTLSLHLSLLSCKLGTVTPTS